MELYATPRFLGDVGHSPKANLTDRRSAETPAGPHFDTGCESCSFTCRGLRRMDCLQRRSTPPPLDPCHDHGGGGKGLSRQSSSEKVRQFGL